MIGEINQDYRILKNRLSVAGLDAIDFGCGEGLYLKLLERKGAKSITGIDFDESAVKTASKNFPKARVFLGDITKTGLPTESFDFAISIEVVTHLPFQKQDSFFVECFRILRRGGILVASVHNKKRFERALEKDYSIPTVGSRIYPITREVFKEKTEKAGFKTLEIIPSNYFGSLKEGSKFKRMIILTEDLLTKMPVPPLTWIGFFKK